MSKCHCGGSNPHTITCTWGCGCIANGDGSDCHCACANQDGSIDIDFSAQPFDLDTPVLMCLHDVDPSSLADRLAARFGDRLQSRQVRRLGRITREKTATTLRALAAEIGLTFA